MGPIIYGILDSIGLYSEPAVVEQTLFPIPISIESHSLSPDRFSQSATTVIVTTVTILSPPPTTITISSSPSQTKSPISSTIYPTDIALTSPIAIVVPAALATSHVTVVYKEAEPPTDGLCLVEGDAVCNVQPEGVQDTSVE